MYCLNEYVICFKNGLCQKLKNLTGLCFSTLTGEIPLPKTLTKSSL